MEQSWFCRTWVLGVFAVGMLCLTGGAAADQHSDTLMQPAAILGLQSEYCLVVEKQEQKLHVYRMHGERPVKVKTYVCSTGQVHGDKQRAGDNKTPEGVYFFNKIHRQSQLLPRYGVMAFVMDYPNDLDRRNRKTGSGIWLHGIDRPLVPYDSQGCVAMENSDLLEVSQYIELNKTPIIVEEFSARAPADRQREQYHEIKRLTEAWRHAWETKDLERYAGFYASQHFKTGEFARWKKHKQSLNERYKFIDIELRDINVLQHNKTIVVSFIQDYESERFASVGFKKLFLQKNDGTPYIVEEDWRRLPARSAAVAQPVAGKRSLARFLNQWVSAWEMKKIVEYIDCYADDFSAQGMNRTQWKEHKNRINNNTTFVQVSVFNPVIDIDASHARVTFVQQYASDSYTDYGIKKLRLRNDRGQWKILSEIWEPI